MVAFIGQIWIHCLFIDNNITLFKLDTNFFIGKLFCPNQLLFHHAQSVSNYNNICQEFDAKVSDLEIVVCRNCAFELLSALALLSTTTSITQCGTEHPQREYKDLMRLSVQFILNYLDWTSTTLLFFLFGVNRSWGLSLSMTKHKLRIFALILYYELLKLLFLKVSLTSLLF